jgi:hypothetical protein
VGSNVDVDATSFDDEEDLDDTTDEELEDTSVLNVVGKDVDELETREEELDLVEITLADELELDREVDETAEDKLELRTTVLDTEEDDVG